MISQTLCQKFELVLAGELVRSGSLLKGLFPKTQLQLALIPGGSSENILRTLRSKPLALLGSSFFHSKYFNEVLRQVDFALEAQVSFGHEYQQCEKIISAYLKAGHLLQVWFEKPQDLEKIEGLFKKYRDQVTPVFILSKKANPLTILEKIEDSSLAFLCPPKEHKRDVYLSPQELLLWSQKLRQKKMPQILYFDSLFEKRDRAEKLYYQNLDGESLKAILNQQIPTRLELLGRALRNLPLTVASKIKWTSYSLTMKVWGELKALAVTSYWRLRILHNQIKIRGLRLKWALYSLSLRTTGQWKALRVKAYWQIRKRLDPIQILGLRLKWTTYSLGLKALGQLKALSVKVYWQIRQLADQIKRVALKVTWSVYPLGPLFLGKFKALSVRSYWWCRQNWNGLKKTSLHLRWKAYSVGKELAGQFKALSVRGYWQSFATLARTQIVFIRLRWTAYSGLQTSLGLLRRWALRLYWSGHRLFQKVKWSSYHWMQQGAGKIRKAWGESHGLRIRLSGQLGVAFLRGQEALKKISWPLRKVYWFCLYQWQQRALPRLDRRKDA